MLRVIDTLPEGLLELAAHELEAALGGPTLIHLPGRREPPLFCSLLLHGNETVGWEAVRGLLLGYRHRSLPRSLSLFLGNLAAARAGVRRLDGQPDYNRVWPGGDPAPRTPEQAMMAEILDIMARRRVFASVDLHNNTGINPHYACINRLDPPFLHLAALFSRILVFFLQPRGVQSMAMAGLCPSVTLECGKVGQWLGVEHARRYLEACLHLAEISEHEPHHQDIAVYHSVAQLRISPGVGFSFAGEGAQVDFVEDLDHLNFRELPAGTAIARLHGKPGPVLEVVDAQGREVGDGYLEVVDDELRLRTAIMPSMLTTDREIVRQDCLGYLMEKLDPVLWRRRGPPSCGQPDRSHDQPARLPYQDDRDSRLECSVRTPPD